MLTTTKPLVLFASEGGGRLDRVLGGEVADACI